MKSIKYFSILLIIFTLMACSTVPLINRKQVLLVPQSEMLSMSHSSYREFLNTNNVASTSADAKRVKMIGSNISQSVETFLIKKGLKERVNQFSWEFNLVNDPTPNAWCMPGGKVVFYSGILPYCKTDDGIAVVMAHEIAHAVARHGNERMSQNLMVSMGNMAFSQFIKEQPEKTKQFFLSAFAVGSQVGIMLPYSRKHEYEADKLGLIFMAMAGYNPQEAINFWERMMESGGAKPPEFLSTHPSDINRINAMKKAMPEAMSHYRETLK